ncbi:MAG: DEAD/DEAH box helicase [Gammaproteobacteria bacterium]|nr:DEAD/DEAH box helicase [Gammaproteobacteria bacterium]
MSFESLHLNPDLLRAVRACGFSEPTDIQRQAVPVALAGRDLMASAQTGTGKTAAFILPVLQRLATPSAVRGVGPRALVLTPTRELAAQVEENIRLLGRFSRIVSGSVVGGMPYPPQIRMLAKPMDLLVATPGRLMDHMERGRVKLSRVEVLILDEADRMLDMGFIDAVRKIAAATPAQRQTLLFSATLEGRVLEVARGLLRDPVRIQLAASTRRHESIVQQAHHADDIRHKHRLLAHVLGDGAMEQAVVFTATKRGAETLAGHLRGRGHECAPLHGDMNQSQRRRTVERMRRGNVRVLVATDVAARGLDIRTISHVVNFDLPRTAEDYIHRIGRTGRAGASGKAISLVGPDDWPNLVGIERLLGAKLQREVIAGLEPCTPEPRGGVARPNGKRRSRPGGGRPNVRYKARSRAVR